MKTAGRPIANPLRYALRKLAHAKRFLLDQFSQAPFHPEAADFRSAAMEIEAKRSRLSLERDGRWPAGGGASDADK